MDAPDRGDEIFEEGARRARANADTGGNLSLEEALRLQYSIGLSITYSGLTPIEVEERSTVPEEWSKLSQGWCERQIDDWGYRVRPAMYVFPLAVALAAWCLPKYRSYLLLFVFLICWWLIDKAAKAQGLRAGFFNGFDSGFAAGVHNFVGIDASKHDEFNKLVGNLHKDGMMIQRLNAQRGQPCGTSQQVASGKNEDA